MRFIIQLITLLTLLGAASNSPIHQQEDPSNAISEQQFQVSSNEGSSQDFVEEIVEEFKEESYEDSFSESETLELKDKLRQVFDLDDAVLFQKEPLQKSSAPEYMLDLYRQSSDLESGVSKQANPYNANIIRSFQNQGYGEMKHFWFDVEKLNKTQDPNMKLVGAEFHIYKHVKKQLSSADDLFQFVQVQLYRVTRHARSQLVMIDSRVLSTHGSGWEIFNIPDVVSYWLANPDDNLGLVIIATGLDGKELDGSHVIELVTSSKAKKQPILVAFADDRNNTDSQELREFDPLDSLMAAVPDEASSTNHSRTRRSATNENRAASPPSTNEKRPFATRGARNCERLPMYVDFAEIGWSGWIISPTGYNAYYCKGECPFPLSQMHRPSNHATVQSIVHAIGSHDPSPPRPCCVPDRLYSINLLYFDQSGDVILKQYEDMVAASCGCH
uniref:Anti-dorsalizing morphogenetic protein ADMP n=1 Tax=Isodiametra pulchra TaxID=504439 RepID=A0A2P1DV71_ISOPU|nr:anti-dorsalizing morphogenetic protein ADMP [Isodiametra pulchra]